MSSLKKKSSVSVIYFLQNKCKTAFMFLCYHLNILWEQSVDFQESAGLRLQTIAMMYGERIQRLQSSSWTGIQQDMKALQ